MIPTWLKLSSIVCSSGGDTLSCAGRPTGPGISSLTYTTTSGHHRRYLPDFPEITGQSFRNPQAADFRQLHDPFDLGRLDPPDVRRILIEREVSAGPVIVREVRGQDAAGSRNSG